jgi:hypothetical protein
LSDASQSLYVGTVAGSTYEVVTRDSPIRISGPVDGKVLAWWDNGDATTFVVADTDDGTRTTVLREQAIIGAGASLDPSGRFIYMTPVEREGRIDGLFRIPVDGGERERVLDGWDGSVAHMIWALDGRWLAITGMDVIEVEHRIFDPSDAETTMTVHRGTGIRIPIGFIGDGFVGYLDRGPERERQYPILALDLGTDRVRTLVDGWGTYADILPSADGSPVLVYDQPDAESRYTLRITDGASESRLLYSSDDDYNDASMGDFGTSSLVGTDEWRGVESPGFVPVFAGGVAYTWPDGPSWSSDARVMIDMATGEQFDFETGELQP